MRLSIIIPVFNEQSTIVVAIKRVEKENLDNIEKEVIVVNDGSTDTTALEIQKTKFKIKNFKLLHHSKNLGKGAAVATGIKNATGEYVIIQDADLEYHPKYINDLIKPIINKRAEVVYGTRINRFPNLKGEEKTLQFLTHYLGNRFLSLLTSILYGQWITDMETGYKLFPKKALANIKILAKGFEFEPEITAKLMKAGYKIYEVSIKTIPRGYNEGKKIDTIRDGAKAIWYLLKYRFSS
jgi:dolichol-phosphate mannosyltransferase